MANEKRLQLPTRLPLARLRRRFQAPGMAFGVVAQGLACLSEREAAQGEKLRSEFQFKLKLKLHNVTTLILYFLNISQIMACGQKMHFGLSRARSKRRDIPKYRHVYLSSLLRSKYLVCPHLFHLIILDVFQLESRYWVISSWPDVFKSSPLQGKKTHKLPITQKVQLLYRQTERF